MTAAEDSKPDTITVSSYYEEEIPAVRADLHITIKGSSLVTGNAALTKAQEVRQLVSDLKAYGVEESDIHLQGVHAEVSSGLLGKSSSATYSLLIHCSQLDQLADILGIITSQKNTIIRYIEWGYEDDPDAQNRWLARCIERAAEKARVVATRLKVKLIGIYRFTEADDRRAQFGSDYDTDVGAFLRQSRAGHGPGLTSVDLGLEVTHSKTVSVAVIVEYRVSDLIQPD